MKATDVDHVRSFFARRYWLRACKEGVISNEEYDLLKAGTSLPKHRMEYLSAWIDGYQKARNV